MIKQTIIICQFEDVKILESFELLTNKYSRQGLVTNTHYVRIPTISFNPDYPSKYTAVTYNAIRCDADAETEKDYNYVFVPEDAEVRIVTRVGDKE